MAFQSLMNSEHYWHYWIVQLKLSICFFVIQAKCMHTLTKASASFFSSMSKIKLNPLSIIVFSLCIRCTIIRRYKLCASVGKDAIFYKNSCKWVDGFSNDWTNEIVVYYSNEQSKNKFWKPSIVCAKAVWDASAQREIQSWIDKNFCSLLFPIWPILADFRWTWWLLFGNRKCWKALVTIPAGVSKLWPDRCFVSALTAITFGKCYP